MYSSYNYDARKKEANSIREWDLNTYMKGLIFFVNDQEDDTFNQSQTIHADIPLTEIIFRHSVNFLDVCLSRAEWMRTFVGSFETYFYPNGVRLIFYHKLFIQFDDIKGVNWRWIDNTMAKGQTMIYKTEHRKLTNIGVLRNGRQFLFYKVTSVCRYPYNITSSTVTFIFFGGQQWI